MTPFFACDFSNVLNRADQRSFHGLTSPDPRTPQIRLLMYWYFVRHVTTNISIHRTSCQNDSTWLDNATSDWCRIYSVPNVTVKQGSGRIPTWRFAVSWRLRSERSFFLRRSFPSSWLTSHSKLPPHRSLQESKHYNDHSSWIAPLSPSSLTHITNSPTSTCSLIPTVKIHPHKVSCA